MPTKIEWTDETWNPTRGCSRVSAGCDNCYAMRQAHRFNHPGRVEGNGVAPQRQGKPGPYYLLTRIGKRGIDWSGVVRLVREQLTIPLRWRKPRRVFVNSMSDLFHESLSNEEIAVVFGVMAACPQHTFQILTKRAKRMREWFEWVNSRPTGEDCGGGTWHPVGVCANAARARALPITIGRLYEQRGGGPAPWPLPNVWLGISAEDQQRADERIPDLLATPAAIRFVSAEPLIGPLDIAKWSGAIDWLIVGGESGRGARPMHERWARELRNQCKAAQVPFFFKQQGTWTPDAEREPRRGDIWFSPDGRIDPWEEPSFVGVFGGTTRRAGQVHYARTRKTSHLLDGEAHTEFPVIKRP